VAITSVIERELIVDAPLERVWPILRDVPRAAACAPGTVVGEEIAPGVYRAQLGIKLGPFKLGWDATLAVERLDEAARSAEFVIRGDPGSAGGSLLVRIATSAEAFGEKTRIYARNVMEVDGTAAKLGAKTIETAANGALERFGKNLTALVR
jgi:carbon monoxide dehydrogenase subunit G